MGVGGGKCVQGGGVVLIFLATAVAIFVDEPFLNHNNLKKKNLYHTRLKQILITKELRITEIKRHN